MKTLQYLILFFSLSSSVFSQEGCNRLYDSINIDESIIISSQERYSGANAVISKITTSGDEQWRIESDDGFSDILLYHFSDSYLYALLRGDSSRGNNSKILKINIGTGDIIWESDIYDDYIIKLVDYNSEQLFFYYITKNTSGGSTGFKVFLINKSDSTLNETHSTDEPAPSYFVLDVDSKGNLYFSGVKYNRSSNSNEQSIKKVSGINIHNTIWEKSFLRTSTNNSSLDQLRYIIIDKFDNIYAFNGEDDVDLFKINSNTGEEIWSINNLVYDSYVSDYKFLNNELYVSHRHSYVGSGRDYFNISKINTSTGDIFWNTNNSVTIVGSTTSSSFGDHDAIQSFEFDCNGDIFATGYYGSANYSPGAWGIMKINNQDGSNMADVTITQDIELIDDFSVGKFTFFINDEFVFLGNLQHEAYNSTKFLVKTDTDLAITHQYGFDCAALLSTDEFIKNEYSINVYPNPTSDLLNIQVPNNQSIKSLNLFSINGTLIKQWKQNQSTINIKNLSSGIYFLEITLKGNSNVIKKIIKH